MTVSFAFEDDIKKDFEIAASSVNKPILCLASIYAISSTRQTDF